MVVGLVVVVYLDGDGNLDRDGATPEDRPFAWYLDSARAERPAWALDLAVAVAVPSGLGLIGRF